MKRINTIQVMKEYLAAMKDDDFGAVGKAAEMAIREYLQPYSKRNGMVTPQSSPFADMKLRGKNGKYYNFEIKTACGELGTIGEAAQVWDSISRQWITEKPSLSEMVGYIAPNADYIIYIPVVNLNKPIEEQGAVIPREDFINAIEAYDCKPIRYKQSRTGNMLLTIQSFYCETRPKASGSLRAFWDDLTAEYKGITVFTNTENEEIKEYDNTLIQIIKQVAALYPDEPWQVKINRARHILNAKLYIESEGIIQVVIGE